MRKEIYREEYGEEWLLMSECKGFKDQSFFILWGRGSENFRGNIWFSWRTEGEVGLVVAKRV